MNGAYLYAVRCNFAEPEREAAWNQWYSGAKLVEMLRKPHFLAVQRFAAAALDTRRKYLALWLVASPAAFTTPEYRTDWGFFEWTPHIRDWSRDLYQIPAAAGEDGLAEIGPGDALYLAACDGMDRAASQAAATRLADHRPGLLWLEAVGLDRYAPLLGLKKIARAERPAPLAAMGLVETVFEPITARIKAKKVPPAGTDR